MRTSTAPPTPGDSRAPRAESGEVDAAFLEFASETHRPHRIQTPAGRGTPPRPARRVLLAAAMGILVLAAAGIWAWRPSTAAVPSTGSVRIESDPAGADVTIGGTARGVTPLTVALPVGEHEVVVQHAGRTQTLNASVRENAQTVHHVTWAAAVAPEVTVTRGRLQVTSDPPGAVTVDGRSRGTSPVLIEDLEEGDHQVVVQTAGTTHRRTVRIRNGATASLVIANPAPAGIASGWLVPRTPVPMQIRENGQILGTTESERILLPVGPHDLEFVSDALGFRQSQTVTITTGQPTRTAVEVPETPVNINAVPWAEVYVNGAHVGQTPIANLPQRLGTHKVEFRHPQYGRRSVSMTVTLKEPVRVSVDMREP